MSTRDILPPYPNSWYLFAFSNELPRGGVLSRPFMGQDVVVFRTQSGQACAVDAFCPHLGAHFGYGGTVEGEVLRCPFHGFCFDTQGNCTRTGYGTKPPPKAKLKTCHLREVNRMLFIYHDANSATPTWEIPSLDLSGWTRTIYRQFKLRDHPQETTENSVDVGHFAIVHKYRNVRTVRDFITDGPHLSTAYAVQRLIPGLERLLPNVVFDFEFDTQIYGLGYSMVNVTVPMMNVHARLWVLPTPIDEEHITLTLATSIKKSAISTLANWIMLSMLSNDATQDFAIWQNKRYLDPPALAEGDGPIGKYRQWAKQFYPR